MSADFWLSTPKYKAHEESLKDRLPIGLDSDSSNRHSIKCRYKEIRPTPIAAVEVS